MANTKRRPAKTKTPPCKASIGSLLRLYAPDEVTYLEAVERAEKARERGLEAGAPLASRK